MSRFDPVGPFGHPPMSAAVRAIISKPLRYDDSELLREDPPQDETCTCDGFHTGACQIGKRP